MAKSVGFLLVVFCFFGNLLLAQAPDWTVNPDDFEHQVNLSAQLYLNDELDNNAGNLIAAFVGNELRGVAPGVQTGNTVYYFMTIYSSSPSTDTVRFETYLTSEDEVFSIEEELLFTSINPGSIYPLNSYLDIDQPINLLTVEPQVQVQGFSFEPIPLLDYLVQVDNDPIDWTVGFSSRFSFFIIDDTLYTTIIDPAWSGTELINLTATEQTPNAYSASVAIPFVVLEDYGPPDLQSIPHQKIGLNQQFENVELSDFLSPYPGITLAFDYFMPQTEGAAFAQNWKVKAKLYQYSMNVTTQVQFGNIDHANSQDRLLAYIDGALRGVVSPTYVNGQVIYFLTVYSNESTATVDFKMYDAIHKQLYELPNQLTFQDGLENGSPDSPLHFNTAPLAIEIDEDGNTQTTITRPGWIGQQTVAFIAFDTLQPLINADTSFTIFEVVDEYAPEILNIPDQYVEQGNAFEAIFLKDYLVEYDGDAIAWSVEGAENLDFSIGTKSKMTITILDPNWIGTEEILLTATDQTSCALSGTQSIRFTVGGPNQPPEFFVVPDQVIGLGDTFPTLDLNTYLDNANNDVLSWSYFFKKQNLAEATPDWSINAGSFQYNMTMTVQVNVRLDAPDAGGHQLAAFHEGQLRGLANAQRVGEDWLYFITIYSNQSQSQDSIYFKYYDPEQTAVYAVDDTIQFLSQQQLGTIEDPYQLYAGFVDPQPQEGVLYPALIDREWIGEDTLYVVATELGTHERYSDTVAVVFRVQVSGPILPVDLIRFTGHAKEGEAWLDWEIANPDRIYAYEIYRQSEYNSEWKSIGNVLHEADKFYYHFVDQQPTRGNSYYRLKMIDLNGRLEYSDIVNVSFANTNLPIAKIYPNPVIHQHVYLELVTHIEESLKISIVNTQGQILNTLVLETLGQTEFIVLDVDGYVAGQYFLHIKAQRPMPVIPFSIVKD